MKIDRRAFLRSLCFLFGLALCFSLSGKALAKVSSDKEIRVGIFPLGNFQNFTANGEAWGYNVDYLSRIAEYTGWSYKFVRTANWVESVEMLEAGELDLLAPAQNIPSLSERFSYAPYPMATECAAIYALSQRDDLVYEGYDKMRTLHYGAVKDSTFTREFVSAYAKRLEFEPEITYYNNTTELFNALKDKEVDAIVTNIMFYDHGIKILDRFSPIPVYYISTNDNKVMLEQVYQALCAIELNNSAFTTELMERYFPHYQDREFSKEEYAFIGSMPEVTIGYVDGLAPLCYKDRKTGEMGGISRQILDKIEDVSGIRFRYQCMASPVIDMKYLEDNNIFAVINARYNSENMSVKQIRISNSYLASEMVLIGKKSDFLDLQADVRVAIVSGSETLPVYIARVYPTFDIEQYKSVEDCLSAVLTGKEDAFLLNRFVAERYLIKPRYQQLQVIPAKTIDENLCLGVLYFDGKESELMERMADERFLSVINKSIAQISQDEVNNIVLVETLMEQHLGFGDFAYKYRYNLFLCAAFLISFIVFTTRSKKLVKKKNQELEGINDQLALAIQQANAASDAKSKFLSHMSHEIRTPMNSIVGMTGLALREKNQPPKIKRYLEKIDVSSKLLLEIINDILDMASIESHKMKIAKEPMELSVIMASLAELYEFQCRQKGISFKLMMESVAEETLLGDSLRVNQILNNLLSNACKFTDSGGEVVLLVSARRVSGDSKVYVRFVVEDTGCGMSEEMVRRLFQAFEQEDVSTAREHGGSGLGLCITKNLVDLMQGAIQVSSEKGKGTQFIVDLPMEPAKDKSDTAIISAPQRTGEVSYDFTGYHALIAEDFELNQELIQDLLDIVHLESHCVENGKKAVELFLTEPPGTFDIILMDIQMPEMDGYQATEKIRRSRHPQAAAIPIYAMTANAFTEDVSAALASGMNGHIAKPIDAARLYQVLEQALKE